MFLSAPKIVKNYISEQLSKKLNEEEFSWKELIIREKNEVL